MYKVEFSEDEPFVGLAGYVDSTSVTALGFFRYMCQVDEPVVPEEVPGEE